MLSGSGRRREEEKFLRDGKIPAAARGGFPPSRGFAQENAPDFSRSAQFFYSCGIL
jgi:hypothetical protein